MLTACSAGGPEEAFDTYISRLERTLDETAPAITAEPFPSPPRSGALRIELESSSVDALDFLALSGCALQITVGKRNSSLGRMAPDSQRLLLELEFLRHAPACVVALRDRGKPELAQTIEAAAALKREQLPARLFNATLGAAEFRQMWRTPQQLGLYPQNSGSRVVSALHSVNLLARRWLGGDYRADNAEFELLLGDIARADGGALAAALSYQSARLRQADEVLGQRARRGPRCSGARRDRASDVLQNVVAKFFAAGIQPWSAALERRRQELLPPLLELEALLQAVLPADYRQWRDERIQLLSYWASAPKRHVAAIQSLQSPCENTG